MSGYKTVTSQTTVSAAIADANSEVESIADEMREWADNIEEKFSTTDKYQRINDAAETLENLDKPDETDMDSDADRVITVGQSVQSRKGRATSRACRAGNAASLYDAAASELRDYAEELREKVKTLTDQVEIDPLNKYAEEADELADACEAAKDEVEGVELPGMFG